VGRTPGEVVLCTPCARWSRARRTEAGWARAQVAEEVQSKYGKAAHVTKPLDCETTADFVEAYGDCEEMHHGDFDMHSKIEPFKRALSEVGREVRAPRDKPGRPLPLDHACGSSRAQTV
jgi:hypothetical protein